MGRIKADRRVAAFDVERDVNDLGCAAIPLADATPQRLAERDIDAPPRR